MQGYFSLKIGDVCLLLGLSFMLVIIISLVISRSFVIEAKLDESLAYARAANLMISSHACNGQSSQNDLMYEMILSLSNIETELSKRNSYQNIDDIDLENSHY